MESQNYSQTHEPTKKPLADCRKLGVNENILITCNPEQESI